MTPSAILPQRLGTKLTRAVEGHGRAYRMGGDEVLRTPAAQREEVVAGRRRAGRASRRGVSQS